MESKSSSWPVDHWKLPKQGRCLVDERHAWEPTRQLPWFLWSCRRPQPQRQPLLSAGLPADSSASLSSLVLEGRRMVKMVLLLSLSEWSQKKGFWALSESFIRFWVCSNFHRWFRHQQDQQAQQGWGVSYYRCPTEATSFFCLERRNIFLFCFGAHFSLSCVWLPNWASVLLGILLNCSLCINPPLKSFRENYILQPCSLGLLTIWFMSIKHWQKPPLKSPIVTSLSFCPSNRTIKLSTRLFFFSDTQLIHLKGRQGSRRAPVQQYWVSFHFLITSIAAW